MEIHSTFGIWYIVEVRGESHYVPPGCVSLDIPKGETVSNPDHDDSLLDDVLVEMITEGATVVDPSGPMRGLSVEDQAIATEITRERWEHMINMIHDYVDYHKTTADTVESIEARECWGAQYHMPGYMDQTDWVLGDTEAEAVRECRDLFGGDDDEDDEEPIIEGALKCDMVSGYCHEYSHQESDDEDMETTVYTPRHNEVVEEYRKIDGSWHVVFWCPDDRKFRAQLCVAIGVKCPV